jgi:hypothetical protein
MPSWKKVILSGSDAALNSLNVTTNVTALSFTGSLLGTASFADQALSSSFALTASYASNVPLTASYALQALSSSFALTATSASHALDADNTISSSYALTATSASHALNADNAISASFAISASYAPGANQTLQQVTDNGNTTTNNITVGGITASGLIYPSTDGIVNQAIVTDGAGNLTFGNPNSDNTVITIKNVSGGAIAKGTPLYITGSGTAGNLVGVWPADAGNPARMPAGVIAGEALPNNGDEGIGLINGFINGVDTSAFASGDQVYVAVGGGYTNVVPTGSALVQKLGNVEKSDVSNGSGVINGPGASRSVPNINPGFTWVGNGDWVATPVSTASLFVTSASYAIISTSASHALNADNAISSSYALSGSYSLTATSASHALASDTSISASHALASDTSISASHAIFADTASFLPSTTNLNITSISASTAVFQSASIGFLQTITGSATIIGDAFIILNTNNAQRYAGIIVEDSGSATPVNYTASLQFDSQTNDWFYEYTSSSDPDNFGIVLFGPEYGTKGSPTYLTNNRIPKGDGGHHLNDSNISDDGTTVSINSNTQVTGSLNVSTNITAESLNITSGTGSFTGSFSGVFDGISAGQIATGTGTVNTIAKWNTTSSLTDSSVTDDGSNVRIAVNTTVTGSIINNNAGFTSTTFTSGSSIADATTNEVIFTIDATVYESLTMDYVIFDSTKSNKRAGTLRSTWDDNTSAIVFDETTTTDIGDTTAFTLDASNSGIGTISIRATNNVGSAMTIIYEYKLLG